MKKKKREEQIRLMEEEAAREDREEKIAKIIIISWMSLNPVIFTIRWTHLKLKTVTISRLSLEPKSL